MSDPQPATAPPYEVLGSAASYETRSQLCDRVKKSAATIARWEDEHGLPVLRVGRSKLYPTELVDDWLLGHGNDGARRAREAALAAVRAARVAQGLPDRIEDVETLERIGQVLDAHVREMTS